MNSSLQATQITPCLDVYICSPENTVVDFESWISRLQDVHRSSKRDWYVLLCLWSAFKYRSLLNSISTATQWPTHLCSQRVSWDLAVLCQELGWPDSDIVHCHCIPADLGANLVRWLGGGSYLGSISPSICLSPCCT